MVTDLMRPSGGWNMKLTKQVFVDVDSHAILSTPVRGLGDDIWAWGLERHGLYTIRSAYKLLYDDQCHQLGNIELLHLVMSQWSRSLLSHRKCRSFGGG